MQSGINKAVAGNIYGMVEEATYRGLRAFSCDQCGHHYPSKHKAEQCELYCTENDRADPAIQRQSFEKKQI
jgi:hypothetical protein